MSNYSNNQLTAKEEAEERKKKTKAWIGAFSVYGLLFLLLIFLSLRPPEPPLPEAQGMEIVLGNDAVGMNNTFEPVASGSPQTEPVQETSPPVVEEVAPEPVVDDPESVPIEKKKPEPVKEMVKPKPEPKPEEKPKPVEEKKPERKADSRALFEKNEGQANGPGGTNTSKGTGDKPGDQGDPKGDPNSKSWERGSGTTGSGPGFDLAGRGKLSLPAPKENFQREGRIVVEIGVDRDGNVVSARGGMRGSTITDSDLIRAAEAAAMKAKFTAKEDAPERQFGSITYNFKLE